MCKVSDRLTLCTCASGNITSLKHYWILHRFDANKNIEVIGEIIMPFMISNDADLYNRKLLVRLINEPATFDVDVSPKPKDRLELSFSVGAERLSYGFEYKNKKWKAIEYDTFEWMSHHNEVLTGKIKNAIKHSKNNE